jgi:hypothetical protein
MLRRSAIRLLPILLACLGGTALAASSAASSASESIGFSIGSISGSLKNSSGSSSRATDVAEGDYEVVDIVAIDGATADLVRMTLRAAAGRSDAGDLVLELPRPAVDEGRLARGRIVTARQRPYGVEFASGESGRAFFLVLDDEWFRELRANVVTS